MKLWLLRPINPGEGLWDPWYDKMFGFVVRAETESRARELANENAGDERRGTFLGRELGPAGVAWLDATLSSCVELTKEGAEEIVINDFHAA